MSKKMNVEMHRRAFDAVSEKKFEATTEIPYEKLRIQPNEEVQVIIRESFPVKFDAKTKNGIESKFRLVVELKKELRTLIFNAKATNTIYKGIRYIFNKYENRAEGLDGIVISIKCIPYTHDNAGQTVKYEIKEVNTSP